MIFGSRQIYEKLVTSSKLLIEHAVNYIQNIGFELVHKAGCSGGFDLVGFTRYTRKRNGDLIIWRVQCKHCKKTWSILPEFVLRYSGLCPLAAQKCLYGLYYGASLEVNHEQFNINAMQQYNYVCAIGRIDLISQLCNCGLLLPDYLIVDEKHAKCRAAAIYLPTIVTGRVIWHLGYSEGLSEEELTNDYGKFAHKATDHSAVYKPKGVLTDGFTSTQKSIRNLFSNVIIGICLLHASLLLGRNLKKALGKEQAEVYSKKFFNIIARFSSEKQITVFKIGQRLRRFKEKLIAQTQNLQKQQQTNVEELIDWIDRKKKGWYNAMQVEEMPNTTTALDQAHNAIDRKLFMMKNFHHTNGRQEQFIKGFAALYNIIPYQRRAKNSGKCGIQVEGGQMPAKDWMTSLQILTSAGYQKIRANTT